MPSDKAGKVVFVGNIPYGLSEEQVVHLFSSCGQVLHFRLVYDKETGRSRGYGFAEFADADQAASAVRNLNQYEIMGRTLKVDYSNEAGSGDNANRQNQQQNQFPMPQFPPQPPPQVQTQVNGVDPQQTQPGSLLAQVPQGVDLPPGIACPDAISRTLATVPPPQLLDLISQVKGFVTTEPQKVTALLQGSPQLSYAIFQALLLLGLVDTNVLSQVVQEQNQSQQQHPQQTLQQHPQPFQQAPPMQAPPPQPPQPPQMQQFPQQYHQQMNVPTPPVHNQGYQPPMPPKPPNLDDNSWATIRQILSLPQQDIDRMANPVEKQQVMSLRQQYAPWMAQAGGIPGY